MEFKIEKKMLKKKIEELNFKNPGDIYEYCYKKGVYTVEDFVDKQSKFNKKYGTLIKSKLIFGVDETDPDVFEYD